MMAAAPCIGLVVPPAHGKVPSDAVRLYGDRFRFIARGLGIGAVSPEGFAPVIDQVVDRARELRDAGAQAISMMGTSISFYRGAEFTESLRASMQHATGVPCTTMSHAVLASLRALGVRRVAVATSYIDALNDKLAAYLGAGGFEVTAIEGLSIPEVGGACKVETETLVALAKRVHAQDPAADGIFLSCGGLLTLPAIHRLEEELGVPVTASSPAGFWDVVRGGGWDARSDVGGRLFSRVQAPSS
jgi:arylmalonate decarboxylase